MSTARSALLYLVGSMLQGLGLVLIQPFAVRILDGNEWGLVSTAVVTIQVVVVLLSAGLPLAITQRWFQPSGGRRRASAMYGFLGLACLVVGIVAALVILVASYIVGQHPQWTVALAMVAIAMLGTVLGAQAILRAQGRPGVFVVLGVGSSVVANLAGVAATLLWQRSAVVYLIAYTIAVTLTAIGALVLVRPTWPASDPGSIRESASIGLPLIPHTGALMLLTQGPVLLLAAVSDPAAAGRYGAVLIFALGPITVLNALNNSWATRVMSATSDAMDTTLMRVAREAVLIGTGVGILGSSAGTLGAIILSRNPDELAPVALILPAVSVGYALFLMVSNSLYMEHRTRVMAYLTPAVLVVVLGLALLTALTSNLVLLATLHAGAFVLLGLAYWVGGRAAGGTRWPVGTAFLGLLANFVSIGVLLLMPRSFVSGVIEVVVALGAVGLGALAWQWTQRRRV